MLLDNSIALQAVLGGAVAANQPEYHLDYAVWDVTNIPSKPGPARGALNSNTDVTLLAAAALQAQRLDITELFIYNKDTAAVTVTVKSDDGSTERIYTKKTLNAGETLYYSKWAGWMVF